MPIPAMTGIANFHKPFAGLDKYSSSLDSAIGNTKVRLNSLEINAYFLRQKEAHEKQEGVLHPHSVCQW